MHSRPYTTPHPIRLLMVMDLTCLVLICMEKPYLSPKRIARGKSHIFLFVDFFEYFLALSSVVKEMTHSAAN